MSRFIKKVVSSILETYQNLEGLILILPSNKTLELTKNEFEARNSLPPQIYSMKDWMIELSCLLPIEGFELYIKFFRLVKEKNSAQDFDEFLSWGPSILLDFDEIDLHLIDQEKFFSYLSSAERIAHWGSSFDEEAGKKESLFWDEMFFYYQKLREKLFFQKKGYHGMIFRQALENLEFFLRKNQGIRKIIFIGMNALTTSESELIKALLCQKKADTYWDIEAHFFEDFNQEAGFFMRQYSKNWPGLDKNSIKWVENHFLEKKQIEVVVVSSKIAQVKAAALVLKKELQINHKEKIAVINLDESLGLPLLYSLPREAQNTHLDIKFDYNSIAFSEMFSILMKLFVNRKKLGVDKFYYEDLFELLRNSFFREILGFKEDFFLNLILKKNLNFISDELIAKHISNPKLLKILDPRNKKLLFFIEGLEDLIKSFKTIFLQKINKYQLEFKFLASLESFLFFFKAPNFCLVDEIKSFFEAYEHWIKCSFIFLNHTCETSNLYVINFLESRLLDFDKVIFVGVNEGVLPPEKKNSSQIPFDIRKKFSLPTFKEKEALYAYHFYGLLAKAKTIYLIYNSSLDSLGSGGKSRFIDQLELESSHFIKETLFSSLFKIQVPEPAKIKKSPALLEKLQELIKKGISPSTLTLYIKNPLSFYYKKILHLMDEKKIVENAKGQILGRILHNTLEELYKPFLGVPLTKENILSMKRKLSKLVEKFFDKEAQVKQSGKNFLSFRVVHKYVEEILFWDEIFIEKGGELIICFLEKELSCFLHSSLLASPVLIKGRIDRIEKRNGMIVIVDYKLSLVEPRELTIQDREEFDEILKNPKYDKVLQLLIYAYLWFETQDNSQAISLGIFSFAKLKNGFMSLSIEKNSKLFYEDIKDFLPFLADKIAEILDPELPLLENLEDEYAQD